VTQQHCVTKANTTLETPHLWRQGLQSHCCSYVLIPHIFRPLRCREHAPPKRRQRLQNGARNKELNQLQQRFLHSCVRFLLSLFFDIEYGGGIFIRNVDWLSTDYTMLYLKRYYRCDNLKSFTQTQTQSQSYFTTGGLPPISSSWRKFP
jgi:hypothetical protein